MLIYQQEKLVDVIEEIYPLLQEHFIEAEEGVVEDKEYPLNVDWASYKRMEEVSLLYVFTARDEGKLVGYIWFVVHPALHMTSCLTAYEDIHYLIPSYRKGWNFVKMFKYAEERMKEVGVNRLVSAVKIKSGRDKIFSYLGYTPTEKLFVKGL